MRGKKCPRVSCDEPPRVYDILPKSKGHHRTEIGNDRRSVDPRGIQEPPAGVAAGGPRSLVDSRVGARGVKSSAEERGRKLSFTIGSTTSTLKSAERSEKGADVGGRSLLFINSRRGETCPLCAVRLLVSPTRSSLCSPSDTHAERTHYNARARR